MTRRLVLPVAVAAVLLGAASSAAIASVLDAPRSPVTCQAPPLPGSVVDVTLTDMGAMMGPGMMGPGMMGGRMGPGMMRVLVAPSSVPAGQVSLRVHNTGFLAHEVVVLPLAADQSPGRRFIGSDGEVDEAGSLGEAAQSCGPDGGDGIGPGATGWTTVNLAPGRYELVCNISGHYGSGMFAELDATAVR